MPSGAGGLGQPDRIDETSARSFSRASSTFGSYALSHRQGGAFGYNDAILVVKKDGNVVASIERGSTDGYGHNSYTFTPDGLTIVSAGSNGTLIAYDLKGEPLGEFVGHEGDVRAVTPSPDGRYLVSGSAD